MLSEERVDPSLFPFSSFIIGILSQKSVVDHCVSGMSNGTCVMSANAYVPAVVVLL